MEWTILVVDDEPEIARTLKNFFKLGGYEVMTATDGAQAVEIVRSRKVHVVLMDIKMPRMDGIEALRIIHDYDFSIQVIMMTGYSTFDYTLKALELGAIDYIQKPFGKLEDLQKLVKISTDRLTRWRAVLAGSSKCGKSFDSV